MLYVTPYIPLLFTSIPLSATLEIMSTFLLGLVVIIPTIKGGWNEYSDTKVQEMAEATTPDAVDAFCFTYHCKFFFRKFSTPSASSALFRPSLNLSFLLVGLIFLTPVLFLCVLNITFMIASYFKERSNRKGFIQRKLLQVGADAFSQHNTPPHTDLFPFFPFNFTGSYEAERRHAGEAEVGK